MDMEVNANTPCVFSVSLGLLDLYARWYGAWRRHFSLQHEASSV